MIVNAVYYCNNCLFQSFLFIDEKITAEEATNASGVGMFQVKLVILSGIVWVSYHLQINVDHLELDTAYIISIQTRIVFPEHI